tara:strand:+ start:435 stop:995 length:561 start_codon:yes stop_codon:yes gene_type:complete
MFTFCSCQLPFSTGLIMLTAPETNDGRYFMGDVIDIKNPAGNKLTAKQTRFCQELVYGVDDDGQPLSQSEAYRRAYDTKASDRSVHVNSSKLSANAKVALMVKELRATQHDATVASRLSDRDYVLQGIKAICENLDENSSARMRGYELLGKHSSLWTDQVAVVQPDADALKTQLSARLEELLTVNK